MAELVDQPLRPFCLLHDPLLVVLSDRAWELVIVHGGAVLALAPETSHTHAVLYLEHAGGAVQPPDARSVSLRVGKQLLQELPQVDVRATSALGLWGGGGGMWWVGDVIVFVVWKKEYISMALFTGLWTRKLINVCDTKPCELSYESIQTHKSIARPSHLVRSTF